MSSVVLATAFGGPDVLAVADEPAPEPGPGEARIEVRAAGVNPVDWKAYSGMFGADPSALPMRLGAEAAGVVAAAAPDAVGPAGPVRAGDEVIAFRAPGSYAAELVVPATALVPKPAALGWPQAAGLLLAGVAAGVRQPGLPASRGSRRAPGHHDRPRHRQARPDPLTGPYAGNDYKWLHGTQPPHLHYLRRPVRRRAR
ncbi:MAG TPA: alcohol dehydrogenase catalytic domain-containing protein [Streptosporangiaceae bacterium]